MLRIRVKNNVWLILISFYMIHPFLIKSLGSATYIFIYGIPLVYLITNISYLNNIVNTLNRKEFRYLWIDLLTLFGWGTICIIMNATFEFSFYNLFASYLRIMLRYLFILGLIVKKYPDEDYRIKFCDIFIIANLLYVLSTIVLILFPAIKNVWFSFITQDVLSYIEENVNYANRLSINGFAGYRDGLLVTLGVIFSLAQIEHSENAKNGIKYIFSATVCLIGNLFYSRTSLAISSICILIFLIISRKIKITHIVFVGIIALLIYEGYSFIYKRNDTLYVSMNWALTPFIMLFRNEQIMSGSLYNMTHGAIWMPEIKTFLLGDGKYVEYGHYYMRTDLGIMRLMLFGGIVASIICYTMVCSSIWDSSNKKIFIALALLICFAGHEYKGDIWYTFLPITTILTLSRGYTNRYKYLEHSSSITL